MQTWIESNEKMTTPTHQIEDLFTPAARAYVAPVWGAAQEQPRPLISLAYGLADPALFPQEEIVAATAAATADDPDAALNYGPPAPRLVEQIIARLQAQDVPARPEQVMVSYGSGQIIGLLPDVFVTPGDTVIVEGPTFMGAIRKFARAGAHIVTIPVDAHGLDVAALEATLLDMHARNVRPRFIYTIPTFHNPSGVTMPLERRRKLIELAYTYGVLLVEDDAYGDLRFDGTPTPSLAALDPDGWVLRLSTYSKILAPGMRVGWAYGPQPVIDRLAMFRSEGPSGPFLTHVVAYFSAEGRLEAHIGELTALYREKCARMMAAIERELPSDVSFVRPAGGFFIWLRLPADISATGLLPVAEEHGVTYLPGTACFVDGQGDDAIRLSFSYQPAAILADGIKRLGAAMRAYRERA